MVLCDGDGKMSCDPPVLVDDGVDVADVDEEEEEDFALLLYLLSSTSSTARVLSL